MDNKKRHKCNDCSKLFMSFSGLTQHQRFCVEGQIRRSKGDYGIQFHQQCSDVLTSMSIPHTTGRNRIQNMLSHVPKLSDVANTPQDSLLEQTKNNTTDDHNETFNDDFIFEYNDDISLHNNSEESSLKTHNSELSESSSVEQFNEGDPDEVSNNSVYSSDVSQDSFLDQDIEVPEFEEIDGSNVPPNILAQMDLLKILQKHRVSNMKVFDDIMTWVKHHSGDKCDIWNQKIYPRKTLIKTVSSIFKLESLKPTYANVELVSRKAIVSVPKFDFTALLCDMFNDRRIMQESNFCEEIDVQTGKLKNSIPNEDSDVYGDFCTGDLFKIACDKYANGADDYAVPLVCFYDKSHTDSTGALSTSPFQFTLATLRQPIREHTWAWRVLGYCPNLGVGKGKNHSANTALKCQDEHNVLKEVFSSLRLMIEKGFKTVIFGKEVNVKVWIHCVIGDAAGNNVLCGHYNYFGDTIRPCRKCKCAFNKLDCGKCECVNVTLQELSELGNDPKEWSAISKHNISNAFSKLPLSDDVHGIMGITPPETLHVFLVGIYKYMIAAVHDIMGLKDANKRGKEALDVIFQNVANDLGRQSDRDFPRWSNRFGINDKTRLTGGERKGNLLILLLVLHTTTGTSIVKPRCKKQKPEISYTRLKKTIALILSYEHWCGGIHPKEEVKKAGTAVENAVNELKKNLPRKYKQGWKIIKLHSAVTLPEEMKKFGCGKNTDSGAGEKNHKVFVKDSGQQTQRRISSFTVQVADRVYEFTIIERFYENCKEYCAPISYHEYTTKEDKASIEQSQTVKGLCVLTFEETTSNSVATYSIKWKDKNMNKLQIQPHPYVLLAITAKAKSIKFENSFQVSLHTTFTSSSGIIYRATEYFRGREWYDWAIVRFNDGKEYASKIYGFVTFGTKGFIDIPDNEDDTIDYSEMTDNKIYAIIQTSPNELTNDKMISQFITKQVLLTDHKSIYIVEV